jgi:type III secretion system-like peptide-binding chaperone
MLLILVITRDILPMTTLTPALTELASWTLATEVMRRAPKLLRIIETHPGGGQYDCLSMMRMVPHLKLCSFNRRGSFTAFGAYVRCSLARTNHALTNVWIERHLGTRRSKTIH